MFLNFELNAILFLKYYMNVRNGKLERTIDDKYLKIMLQ